MAVQRDVGGQTVAGAGSQIEDDAAGRIPRAEPLGNRRGLRDAALPHDGEQRERADPRDLGDGGPAGHLSVKRRPQAMELPFDRPDVYPFRSAGDAGLAHSRRHLRPSRSMILRAVSGPHVPASYNTTGGGGSDFSHHVRIGSNSSHADSTSSRRVNSVASPSMQSSSRRSYAVSSSPPNAVPYRSEERRVG